LFPTSNSSSQGLDITWTATLRSEALVSTQEHADTGQGTRRRNRKNSTASTNRWARQQEPLGPRLWGHVCDCLAATTRSRLPRVNKTDVVA